MNNTSASLSKEDRKALRQALKAQKLGHYGLAKIHFEKIIKSEPGENNPEILVDYIRFLICSEQFDIAKIHIN